MLQHMAAAMAHRGPDGAGVWTEGAVGLAHRRLAIIDLSGGVQPMASAETGAVLVFNGEIYNYRELRRELAALGQHFLEHSDTEVVLRAFEEWGEGLLGRLRGMFAFAIWDPRTRRLFAARDRLGIKPFYYRSDSETFLFASELRALTASREFPREVDDASFDAFLRLQYIPGPSTILRGVRQLPPAHWLSIGEDGRIAVSRYWKPAPAADPPRTDADDVGDFQKRFADAVESHLVSDVPVGALLSGGLDSSLVVAHMAAKASGPINTFSIGFAGGERFDERPAARLVAEHFGTIHHERLVTDADAVAALPGLIARMDEPLADYAALPTFLIAEIAAREVKVVLTGEGADELFGGYRRYRRERWLAPLAPLRAPYQATHLFSDQEIGRLTGKRGRRGVRHPSDPRTGPKLDQLNRLLVQDLEGWLADDLLVKVDRMTMGWSLEARVPYLDHLFVEFALTVPARRKVAMFGSARKILMRDAAARMLPPQIANRPKHGFTPPLSSWLANGLGVLAREALADRSARLRQRVDGAEIDRLLNRGTRGATNAHKVWALLVYELWSRSYGAS
jgi:asparagine synthase (glutamine-hydrolysing)